MAIDSEPSESERLLDLPLRISLKRSGSEFYLASKALYTRFSVETVVEAMVRPTASSVDSSMAEQVATLMHELQHMAASSHGAIPLLMSFLEFGKQGTVRRICRIAKSIDKAADLRPPLRVTLRQGKWAKHEELQVALGAYADLANVAAYLEGSSSKPSVDAADELCLSIALLEGPCKLTHAGLFHTLRFCDGVEGFESCPFVTRRSGGGRIPIGARTIMEGWAHSIELLIIRAFLSKDQFVCYMESIHHGEYQVLDGLIRSSLPKTHIEDFATTLIHVAAIAELALNPAIMAGDLEQQPVWLEFHPGWRAIFATKIVNHQRIRAIDPNDIHNEFGRFQRDICAALGWQCYLDWDSDAVEKTCQQEFGGPHDAFTRQVLRYYFDSYRYRKDKLASTALYPINRIGEESWSTPIIQPPVIVGSDGMRVQQSEFGFLPFHALNLYSLALMNAKNPFTRKQFFDWVFPFKDHKGALGGLDELLTEGFYGY